MEIGDKIAEVQYIDVLLKHILNKARKLIKADAGSIYIYL